MQKRSPSFETERHNIEKKKTHLFVREKVSNMKFLPPLEFLEVAALLLNQ